MSPVYQVFIALGLFFIVSIGAFVDFISTSERWRQWRRKREDRRRRLRMDMRRRP